MCLRFPMIFVLTARLLARSHQGEDSVKEIHFHRTFFFFCVEGLSNLLDKAEVEGKIHGCKISSTAPEISHLLFADDSFLFFKASLAESNYIKEILQTYAYVSGQEINYQKSGIMFSSNVRVDKQH